MKRIVGIVLLCFFYSTALFSEASPWWMLFEQGKKLYREEKFGEAMIAFRKAVNAKRDVFTMAESRFNDALATKIAKRSDGQFSQLIDGYAAEDFRQNDYSAMKSRSGGSVRKLFAEIETAMIQDPFQNLIDAMRPVLETRSLDEFGDSTQKIADFIKKSQQYPEAEYWIGLVFRQEAEYEAAKSQFEKAWGMVESLEVPETKYTILYSLAENTAYRGKPGEAFSYYKKILADDPEYSSVNPGNQRMKETMLEMLKNRGGWNPLTGSSGFDKFLSVYRLSGIFALEAYHQCGIIEYNSGRYSEAMVCFAYGVNIIASKVIDELKSVDALYKFQNLPILLLQLDSNPDLSRYAEKLGFYEMLYMLALSMHADSEPQSRQEARYLWKSISESKSAGMFRMKADRQLRSPNVLKP